MNALPIVASPPATPAPAPTGALPGGRAGPTGATSSGSADTQDFAAAIGELAPRPATSTPGTSGTSGASGATGVAAKTGRPKSTSVVRGETAAAGTAPTGIAQAGIALPLAGNLPPPGAFDMPGRATAYASASGGDGDEAIDSIGVVEAASATVSSSAPIATADLSAVGVGPGIAAGKTNTFLRMFGDGIEHVPADLSAAAARVAGAAGTPMPSTEVGDAADRGHPNALGETAAPAGASSAAGVAAETTLVGANAGAEADVAALARSRSAAGTSLAVTAAVNERAGTAEIAAGTGATAGGGAGTGAAAGADPAGTATVAASVGAGGQVTSAVAPARAAISAIAAALGGNGKHAQDLGGGATEAASLAATAPDGASAAAQAAAGARATEASAAAPSRIDAPISSPEFTQAIASRVSYLVDNNLNGATLQVTPPQLGPIELRVTIEAGHAQVSMSAHNPATLDALQSGAPRLRELLSAQGFGQVSVDVSQRSFQDGSPYAQTRAWTPPSASDSPMTMDEAPAAARAPLGMLDAYA
jgi:flagellar hook-length control protein FliK